jgi:hypothetical protein
MRNETLTLTGDLKFFLSVQLILCFDPKLSCKWIISHAFSLGLILIQWQQLLLCTNNTGDFLCKQKFFSPLAFLNIRLNSVKQKISFYTKLSMAYCPKNRFLNVFLTNCLLIIQKNKLLTYTAVSTAVEQSLFPRSHLSIFRYLNVTKNRI